MVLESSAGFWRVLPGSDGFHLYCCSIPLSIVPHYELISQWSPQASWPRVCVCLSRRGSEDLLMSLHTFLSGTHACTRPPAAAVIALTWKVAAGAENKAGLRRTRRVWTSEMKVWLQRVRLHLSIYQSPFHVGGTLHPRVFRRCKHSRAWCSSGSGPRIDSAQRLGSVPMKGGVACSNATVCRSSLVLIHFVAGHGAPLHVNRPDWWKTTAGDGNVFFRFFDPAFPDASASRTGDFNGAWRGRKVWGLQLWS